MIENEQISAYLNRHYRIILGKILDNYGNQEWGIDLFPKLSIIYSLNSDVCESALKYWATQNGISEEDIEAAWDRPRLFNALTYEPKRNNRFMIEFPQHFAIHHDCIASASRPSMYIKTKKIFGITYSKKIKWEPIRITLRDPIGPSVAQSLMELIHYDCNKNNSINEEFNFKIEMLGPVGDCVEKWKIENCRITAVDFGSLSYDDDDMTTCIMDISIGNAILEF